MIFVSLISFFGTGFTIMAFHNDIGILGIFDQITEMVMVESKIGILVLQISYSIGLGVGIIIFFNHIGKRRLTHDPTPIEVSMCSYEDEVNHTLTEVWEREGNSIDAP